MVSWRYHEASYTRVTSSLELYYSSDNCGTSRFGMRNNELGGCILPSWWMMTIYIFGLVWIYLTHWPHAKQYGWHFADGLCVFVNEILRSLLQNSLKFVSVGPVYNISLFVQVMVWWRKNTFIWNNDDSVQWPICTSHGINVLKRSINVRQIGLRQYIPSLLLFLLFGRYVGWQATLYQ